MPAGSGAATTLGQAVIVRPTALGQALLRRPVAPSSVAALLHGHAAAAEFRAIVTMLFPDAAAAILGATAPGATREQARVAALLRHVEAEHFPVYEVESYDELVFGVPFVRNAWELDRWDDLEALPVGELLLLALCAEPYPELGIRHRLHVALAPHLPQDLLHRIPPEGLSPATLRSRLAGTPYAAAAGFAAWVDGETDSVFLDLGDEVEVGDADWTPPVIEELTAQWRTAAALLEQIDVLAGWLAQDPPAHVARLLDAAFGRTSPHSDQEERSDVDARHPPPAGGAALPERDGGGDPRTGSDDDRWRTVGGDLTAWTTADRDESVSMGAAPGGGRGGRPAAAAAGLP